MLVSSGYHTHMHVYEQISTIVKMAVNVDYYIKSFWDLSDPEKNMCRKVLSGLANRTNGLLFHFAFLDEKHYDVLLDARELLYSRKEELEEMGVELPPLNYV